MLKIIGTVGTKSRLTSSTPAATRRYYQAEDHRVKVVIATKELNPASPRAHCKILQRSQKASEGVLRARCVIAK